MSAGFGPWWCRAVGVPKGFGRIHGVERSGWVPRGFEGRVERSCGIGPVDAMHTPACWWGGA